MGFGPDPTGHTRRDAQTWERQCLLRFRDPHSLMRAHDNDHGTAYAPRPAPTEQFDAVAPATDFEVPPQMGTAMHTV